VADYLVTGTDTGVGKTVIAAALVLALREQGIRAVGFKPVETGVDPSAMADSRVLARASGETVSAADPLLQLAEPLAPAVAAERACHAVQVEDIEGRLGQLRREGFTTVVEGAGGVMVPLTWQRGSWGRFYTALDLGERGGLHTIVVARAGLGTLNHTCLTVAMLRSRNIPVTAIVLNGGQPQPSADLAESTNPEALARLLAGETIIYVPHHEEGTDPVAATIPYLRSLVTP
jgi:dethiobiotin synthetase